MTISAYKNIKAPASQGEFKKDLLEAALHYGSTGWPVVPLYPIYNGICSCLKGSDCPGPGKHPWLKQWETLASTDPETIKGWWNQKPLSNIGIAFGPRSGLVLLDCDGPEGRKSLQGRLLPKTVSVQSGRAEGGQHFYFKYDYSNPEYPPLPNKARILPGLDIRSAGGQAVAPPSLHYSGNHYQWLIAPDEGQIAPLPDWIIEELIRTKKSVDHHDAVPPGNIEQYRTELNSKWARAALIKETDILRTTPPGGRNDAVNKAAYSLGQIVAGGGLSQSEVEYEIEMAGMSTGLGRQEVRNAMASGLKAGLNFPRFAPPLELHEVKTGGKYKYVNEETGEVEESEQPKEKDLADYSPDDEGNALAFLSYCPNQYIYCEAYGWMYYNGRYWDNSLAEFKLKEKVAGLLKLRRSAAVIAEREAVIKCTLGSSARIANCLERIQSKVAVPVEIFDADPNSLNCNNGVLNLKTGELSPHSPEYFFTYAIPTSYLQDADTTQWTNFLKEVVEGGEDIIDYLQQAIGYSLTGHTNEEALFYIYGPTRSGKGIFSEVIMAALGKPTAVETDFNTFTIKRDPDSSNFDLAPLKPSRLVFASESNRFNALNTARTKSLTGGNMISCCFKHKDFFSYKPQFKLWMSSNWPVNGDADDQAFWGRFRIINFPNSHLGHEDKTLKYRMKKQNSLEGVLRWMVDGAVKWFCSPNGLETPDQLLQNNKDHRDQADYVQMWLDECTEPDQAYWISNADINNSYRNWCEQNNTAAKSMKALSITLKTKGYDSSVVRRSSNKTSRGVQGLRILD